jgi:uncharacterized protein YegJ (DUF2314 family)
MSEIPNRATIENDGWTLVSAEERQAAHPDTFQIPPRDKRESLSPGDGVKLLFEIETKEGDRVVDRGVDRMWVIVKARTKEGYIGVLDNDPGIADGLNLHEGDVIVFAPENVTDIDRPAREYVLKKYGPSFFQE